MAVVELQNEYAQMSHDMKEKKPNMVVSKTEPKEQDNYTRVKKIDVRKINSGEVTHYKVYSYQRQERLRLSLCSKAFSLCYNYATKIITLVAITSATNDVLYVI